MHAAPISRYTARVSPLLSEDDQVNQAILQYAWTHLFKKIGDGQCFALLREAVTFAHGKDVATLGPIGLDADYVWGRPITTLNGSNRSTVLVEPGDLLQFRDAFFQYPDGSWSSAPHHSGIVNTIAGSKITALQQNVLNPNPDWVQIVQVGTYDISALTQGTITVYHAIPDF